MWEKVKSCFSREYIERMAIQKLFQKILRHKNLAKKYKFTNRKHPVSGMLSVILGGISTVAVVMAIVLTYHEGGEASVRYGMACGLSVLYAIVGEAFGITAFYDRDQFYFFPILGMILNGAVLLTGLYIIYAGVNIT